MGLLSEYIRKYKAETTDEEQPPILLASVVTLVSSKFLPIYHCSAFWAA